VRSSFLTPRSALCSASPDGFQAISWICGWFAVSGWIALVATAGSLAGSLITGVIALLHDDYNVERWHIFLVYLAYMLGACFINIFGLRTLPTINKTAIFW
jgi:choline transport protein